MTPDPFAVFAPSHEESRPATERSSLRAEVEQLATQVAALRDVVERTLLPSIAGQGMPGQLGPGPGFGFPTGTGQQFLQPGLLAQHDARRTVLHHSGGGQVTIGGIEQHLQIDALTNSRTSEQTQHRYLSLDGRTIHDQGDVYACTSCQRYPLTNPRFCTACQEPTCSACLIGADGSYYCHRHNPRPSFWERLFG